MVMSLPDGKPGDVTQGPKDGSPKFSPDGSILAFLRPDEQGQRQIWLLHMNGGEPRQLTNEPGGALEFCWSPNSAGIAFVSEVDPDRLPAGADPGKEPRVRVVRRINHRLDTVGLRYDAHRHIFVAGVKDGAVRQLTDGDWDDITPTWSPDGSRIAFISNRKEDRDVSFAQSEAYVVPAEGGEPVCWSGGLPSIGAMGWSPRGVKLVVSASSVPHCNAWMQGWLHLLESGKRLMRLTDDTIKPLAGFPPMLSGPAPCWRDDDQIVFAGDVRGESFLFRVPAGGGVPARLSKGRCQILDVALDRKGRYAVVVVNSPESPSDLYLVDVDTGAQSQLTSFNAEYLGKHPPAQMEKFSFTREGMEVECRLFLPPGFDSSKKYPLVLDIHGGPHGVFYDAFNPTQQVLATAGYIVLAPNPRGSSSYGSDFVMRVMQDWGGEDYLDLLAAVEKAASRPYVDSKRVGVHGYSYGGYMSSWVVGHTDRFKAAVVGAPVTDLPSMYGTSDIGVSFGELEWGGTAFDARETFVELSPLTYVNRVKTPVLLLHGEDDLRCPISQSEQYFTALKRQGKQVEFVRFPGCNHLFLRLGHPAMQAEYFRRVLDWFDRHLKAE
jgi:dipeptidyl aminopeptidase/acylaminoacyl peptidase